MVPLQDDRRRNGLPLRRLLRPEPRWREVEPLRHREEERSLDERPVEQNLVPVESQGGVAAEREPGVGSDVAPSILRARVVHAVHEDRLEPRVAKGRHMLGDVGGSRRPPCHARELGGFDHAEPNSRLPDRERVAPRLASRDMEQHVDQRVLDRMGWNGHRAGSPVDHRRRSAHPGGSGFHRHMYGSIAVGHPQPRSRRGGDARDATADLDGRPRSGISIMRHQPRAPHSVHGAARHRVGHRTLGVPRGAGGG